MRDGKGRHNKAQKMSKKQGRRKGRKVQGPGAFTWKMRRPLGLVFPEGSATKKPAGGEGGFGRGRGGIFEPLSKVRVGHPGLAPGGRRRKFGHGKKGAGPRQNVGALGRRFISERPFTDAQRDGSRYRQFSFPTRTGHLGAGKHVTAGGRGRGRAAQPPIRNKRITWQHQTFHQLRFYRRCTASRCSSKKGGGGFRRKAKPRQIRQRLQRGRRSLRTLSGGTSCPLASKCRYRTPNIRAGGDETGKPTEDLRGQPFLPHNGGDKPGPGTLCVGFPAGYWAGLWFLGTKGG